jgi:hypothetical protein
MPAALWKEATEAARRYGLNPTAEALRLNYNRLKKHMAAASGSAKQRKQVHAPAIALVRAEDSETLQTAAATL